MDIERIEELIRKRSLTLSEKAEIRDAADEEGIEYTISKDRCRECYEKILLKLFEKKSASVNFNLSRDGYRLRNLLEDITVRGVRICNATIADVEVGQFSQVVINHFFVKNEDRSQSDAEME